MNNKTKQALEQPAQQEPVAWATYLGECAHVLWGKDRPDYPIRYEVPLYTSPQPAPVQQEPVAVVSGYYGGKCVILPIDPARIFNSNTPLYTAPQPCPTCEALARTVMLDQTSHDAQRTWVGLTNAERNQIWREAIGWGDPSHDDIGLMIAIEAKLMEKNA